MEDERDVEVEKELEKEQEDINEDAVYKFSSELDVALCADNHPSANFYNITLFIISVKFLSLQESPFSLALLRMNYSFESRLKHFSNF